MLNGCSSPQAAAAVTALFYIRLIQYVHGQWPRVYSSTLVGSFPDQRSLDGDLPLGTTGEVYVVPVAAG